ncbi:MAG: hypothetical protein LBR11_11030 [Deltaproteobacteria bacterium]|jgi:hypothetical protein|nr:hypothetical protein [Deltaproteobacteria bacterium]
MSKFNYFIFFLTFTLFLTLLMINEPKLTWPPAVEDFQRSFILSPAGGEGLRKVTLTREVLRPRPKSSHLSVFDATGLPLSFIIQRRPWTSKPTSGSGFRRPWEVIFLAAGQEPYILSYGTDKWNRKLGAPQLKNLIFTKKYDLKDVQELKIVGPLTGPPPKRWPNH